MDEPCLAVAFVQNDRVERVHVCRWNTLINRSSFVDLAYTGGIALNLRTFVMYT